MTLIRAISLLRVLTRAMADTGDAELEESLKLAAAKPLERLEECHQIELLLWGQPDVEALVVKGYHC